VRAVAAVADALSPGPLENGLAAVEAAAAHEQRLCFERLT
jgi:hypothetical protein